jgi:hypothetical protein
VKEASYGLNNNSQEITYQANYDQLDKCKAQIGIPLFSYTDKQIKFLSSWQAK